MKKNDKDKASIGKVIDGLKQSIKAIVALASSIDKKRALFLSLSFLAAVTQAFGEEVTETILFKPGTGVLFHETW